MEKITEFVCYIMHLSKQVEGCNHLYPSKEVLDTACCSNSYSPPRQTSVVSRPCCQCASFGQWSRRWTPAGSLLVYIGISNGIIWVFPKVGVPNNHGVFLLNMIILGCVLGVALFSETSIWSMICWDQIPGYLLDYTSLISVLNVAHFRVFCWWLC